MIFLFWIYWNYRKEGEKKKNLRCRRKPSRKALSEFPLEFCSRIIAYQQWKRNNNKKHEIPSSVYLPLLWRWIYRIKSTRRLVFELTTLSCRHTRRLLLNIVICWKIQNTQGFLFFFGKDQHFLKNFYIKHTICQRMYAARIIYFSSVTRSKKNSNFSSCRWCQVPHAILYSIFPHYNFHKINFSILQYHQHRHHHFTHLNSLFCSQLNELFTLKYSVM